MVEDCLAGRIDLVLTKSISRFARNTVDTVTTIRKLREKGVVEPEKQKPPCKARRFQELLLHMADELLLV